MRGGGGTDARDWNCTRVAISLFAEISSRLGSRVEEDEDVRVGSWVIRLGWPGLFAGGKQKKNGSWLLVFDNYIGRAQGELNWAA